MGKIDKSKKSSKHMNFAVQQLKGAIVKWEYASFEAQSKKENTEKEKEEISAKTKKLLHKLKKQLDQLSEF